MTSKRLDTGPSKVDNNLDMPGNNDFNFGDNKPRSGRKVASPIKRGVNEALKGHFTDPNAIREYVGKALPGNYGELADDYLNSKAQVTDALEEARRVTRGPINQLARKLQENVPRSFTRIHRVLQATRDATRNEDYGSWDDDAENRLSQEVNDNVAGLFGEFEDRMREDADQREEVEANRFAQEYARGQAQLDLSAKIARAADHQMRFATGVQLPFMKKSLELQYRMVAGVNDSVKVLRAFAEQSRIQSDSIITNTGLPEVQKQHLSENFKANIRNKFINKTLGGFKEGSALSSMVKNLTDGIRQTAAMAAGGIGIGTMALDEDNSDLAFDEDPDDPKVIQRRRAKQIAKMITKFMPDLAGGASRKMMRKTPRLAKAIFDGNRKIGSFRNNMHSNMRDYARGGATGESDILRDLVGMMLPGRDNDSEINMARQESLKEGAAYDNLSRRSLTEVIPGYLGRILQELQITRTGRPADLLTYNFNKGRFDTTKSAMKDLRKETHKDSTTTMDAMRSIMSDIERTGVKLTPAQREDLQRALVRGRKSGTTMTARTLSGESFYKNMVGSDNAPALAEAMRKYLSTAKGGEFKNAKQGTRASDRLFANLARSDSDAHNIRQMVQQLFDSGQGELAYESGWMRPDGSIDIRRVQDTMAGLDKGPAGKGGLVEAPGVDGNQKWSPNANAGFKGHYNASYGMPGALDGGRQFMPKAEKDLRASLGSTPESLMVDAIRSFHTDAISSMDQIMELMVTSGSSGTAGGMPGMPNMGDIGSRVGAKASGWGGRIRAGLGRMRDKLTGKASSVDQYGREMYNSTASALGGVNGQSLADFLQKHDPRRHNDPNQEMQGPPRPGAQEGQQQGTNYGDPNFWDRGLRDHGKRAGGFFSRMAGKIGRGAKAADKGARRVLFGDEAKGYGEGTYEAGQRSRLIGARYFKDFKDGLPEIGDVYVPGDPNVVISAEDMSAGRFHDREGKVIFTLIDLAEAKGDIMDSDNNVVLSFANLKKSYVKADGEVIREVWWARLARTARLIGKAGQGIFKGGSVVATAAAAAVKSAVHFARSVVTPPIDVYVKGETEPRLYAYMMKRGSYFNKDTGETILYPTQIDGPVMDEDGNTLLSPLDFAKGIVDVEGKPIRTVMERVASRVRSGAKQTWKVAKSVGRFAGRTLRSAAKLGGAFFSRGLTGVMSGTWKDSYNSPEGGDGDGNPMGASQSVLLLTEIRDIMLATMMPRKGGRRIFGKNKKQEGGAPEQGANINDPSKASVNNAKPEEANRGNTVDGLGGLMGGVFNLGKRMFKRRGNKDHEMNSADALEDPKTKKSALRQERLLKAAELREQREKKKDTEDLRKGSFEERRANWKNINDPTKTLDDVVTPEKSERMNTLDMIAAAVAKGVSFFGDVAESIFGGDGDGLDYDGPDDERRKKRGRKGRGRGPKGGGKKGFFRKSWDVAKRGGEWAWDKTVRSGAGRAVAGKVAEQGTKKLGTALLVGGTGVGLVYTMKEAYDFFSPEKKQADSAMLQVLRLAEYGFSPKDQSASSKMIQLEEMIADNVKNGDGGLVIDGDKLTVEPIMMLFGARKEDPGHVGRFINWFNQRFKPTYLKWMTVAKAVGKNKNMAALDDVDSEQRIKVLEATDKNTGWDVMTNPFGGRDLVVGASEVSNLRKGAKNHFEKKKSKAAASGVSETMTKKEALGLAGKTDPKLVSWKNPAGFDMSWMSADVSEKLKRGENSRNMAKYTSSAMARTKTDGLSTLQSIRLRLYGYKETNMGDVTAIRNTEAFFTDGIVVDDKGVGIYDGDIQAAYEKIGKYFGLSPSDAEARERWMAWIKARFLPVFVTFIGQLKMRSGAKLETAVDAMLDDMNVYEIAQAITGVDVWSRPQMPIAGQTANTDPKTVEAFIKMLREAANSQKARETVPKETPQTPTYHKDQSKSSADLGGGTSRSSSTDDFAAQRVKANAMWNSGVNAMPDTESEPKQGGSASAAPEGTKSAPNPTGLVKADGEIGNGSNGMQWVKVPNASHIDNLNPEMRRLFLAMAEEYGEQTQQKIQVNRGWVSFEDQKREHAANPRKAAPPGGSNHEFGLALDINTVDMNRLEKLGLLRKYGFTRPVGGETWHMEPAGIQGDFKNLRKDPGAAAEAIKAGIGQGGGGVGATKTGFRFGGRDASAALATRRAGDTSPSGDSGIKNASTGAGGSFAGSVQNSAGTMQTSAPSGAGEKHDMRTAGGTADSGGGMGGQGGGSAPTTAPTSGADAYNAMPKGSGREGMKEIMMHAAKVVGIDPKDALMTAAMESSFNPDANSGQAKGLMQFTDGTWGDVMKKYAKEYGIPSGTSPNDPRAAAILGARYLKENMKDTGSGLSPIEIGYLKYFLGPTGGARAVKMGMDANMAEAYPSFAKKNKDVFYNPDGSAKTKAQFMASIRQRMEKTAKDFGIPLPNMSGNGGGSTISDVPSMKGKSAPAQGPDVPAPRTPAPGSQSRSQPAEAFFDTRAASAVPATQSRSQSESALQKSVDEGVGIAKAQLQVLEGILETSKSMVEIMQSASKQASAPAVQGPPEPSSRAERATRSISPPSYRTT